MMTTSENHTATEPLPAGSVFSRVVVGVDGTPASLETCRQVARLAEPGADVTAAAVVHVGEIARAGMDAPALADVLQREAEEALDEAIAILGASAGRRSLNGFVVPALRLEVERHGATLLALGSHGHRRMTEILIGGVAGELLHTAPCSVLVTRPAADADAFPRAIVAGHDGSATADAAVAQARLLAERLDVPLRVLAGARGRGVDLDRVRDTAPAAEVVDAHPVEALVAASGEADLVVVGSRALVGVPALGSVSERVAHQARCSVLVVRPSGAATR